MQREGILTEHIKIARRFIRHSCTTSLTVENQSVRGLSRDISPVFLAWFSYAIVSSPRRRRRPRCLARRHPPHRQQHPTRSAARRPCSPPTAPLGRTKSRCYRRHPQSCPRPRRTGLPCPPPPPPVPLLPIPPPPMVPTPVEKEAVAAAGAPRSASAPRVGREKRGDLCLQLFGADGRFNSQSSLCSRLPARFFSRCNCSLSFFGAATVGDLRGTYGEPFHSASSTLSC